MNELELLKEASTRIKEALSWLSEMPCDLTPWQQTLEKLNSVIKDLEQK